MEIKFNQPKIVAGESNFGIPEELKDKYEVKKTTTKDTIDVLKPTI